MPTLGEAVVYINGNRTGLTTTLDGAKRQTQQWAQQTAQSVNQTMTEGVRGGISGLASTITRTLGSIGLAGMGLQTLADGAKSLGNALGIGLNSELETVRAQLMAFTKDAGITEAILVDIRKEANQTPFAFQEMAKATAGLMSSAKAAGEPLMGLVKTAEILAASNPAEGLTGAAFALREAVSGDFTSIIERFNLPRQYINQLKEEGLPALEIVRKAMLQMGYDADLVSRMAETGQGRWSTFLDTLDTIRQKASESLFAGLKDQLQSAQGWFDDNQSTVMEWVARVSAGFSLVIDGVGTLASAFASGLGSVLDIVITVGQAIYDALSWINPFAEHSPSLVSQVQGGVEMIGDSYADLTSTARGMASGLESAMTDVAVAITGPLDELERRLKGAQDALRRFTNTPLAGSKQFEDQQNALDDAAAKIELAMARMRAAGTDKTQSWDKQGKAVLQTSEAYKKLEEELKRIRAQADVVRLEERVQLDPLRRKLKEIADDKPEMPFEDLARGAIAARREVDALTPVVANLQATAKKGAGGGGAGGAGAGGGMLAGLTKGFDEYKQKAADALKAQDEWSKKVDDYKRQAQEALKPLTDFWKAIFGEDIKKTESGGFEWIAHMPGLIDRIKDAFNARGFAGVAELVQEAIGGELAKIQWGAIWDRVRGKAGDIWSGLLNIVLGEENKDAGQASARVGGVVSVLQSAFAGIPWGDIWSGIQNVGAWIATTGWSIIAEVTTWLAREFGKIDWSVIWGGVSSGEDVGMRNVRFGGIKQTIMAAIGAENWADVGVAINNKVAEAVDAASGQSNVEPYRRLAEEATKTIVRAFIDFVKATVGAPKMALELILALFTSSSSESSRTGQRSVGEQIVIGIWEGIKAAWAPEVEEFKKTVAKSAATLGKTLSDGVTSAFDSVLVHIEAAWNATLARMAQGLRTLGLKQAASDVQNPAITTPEPGHEASGTPSWRGGWTWMGEVGPELVRLPRGSQVLPAHQVGRLADGTASLSFDYGRLAQAVRAGMEGMRVAVTQNGQTNWGILTAAGEVGM